MKKTPLFIGSPHQLIYFALTGAPATAPAPAAAVAPAAPPTPTAPAGPTPTPREKQPWFPPFPNQEFGMKKLPESVVDATIPATGWVLEAMWKRWMLIPVLSPALIAAMTADSVRMLIKGTGGIFDILSFTKRKWKELIGGPAVDVAIKPMAAAIHATLLNAGRGVRRLFGDFIKLIDSPFVLTAAGLRAKFGLWLKIPGMVYAPLKKSGDDHIAKAGEMAKDALDFNIVSTIIAQIRALFDAGTAVISRGVAATTQFAPGLKDVRDIALKTGDRIINIIGDGKGPTEKLSGPKPLPINYGYSFA